MFVKQITTRLKEQEQHERETGGGGGGAGSSSSANTLSVSQCDRLIRTVSCKHDTNHAIRKTNINVLQTFDDIKLYVSPSYCSMMMQPQHVQQQLQQQFIQQNLRQHQLSPPPAQSPNRLLAPNAAQHSQQLGDEISATNELAHSLNDSLRINESGEIQPESGSRASRSPPPPLNFDRPPTHQSRAPTRSTAGLPPQSPSSFGDGRKVVVPNAYASAAAAAASDISEINAKDLLELIVENLACTNVSQWFTVPTQTPASAVNYTDPLNSNLNLVESIQQALTNIDFNLKRNSDFINELTKLLDTSRVIKQEAYLKKALKTLEDEKMSSTLNVSNTPNSGSKANLNDKSSASQPSSPALNRAATTKADDKSKAKDETKKKVKSKSFRFPSSFTRSSSSAAATKDNKDTLTPNTLQSASSASPIGPASLTPEGNKSQSYLNVNSGPTGTKFKSTSNIDLNYYQAQHNEVNNSDYIELEVEVEKISYHLDTLYRAWSKLYNLIVANRANQNASSTDQLKFGIEFQSLINTLNSPLLVKDLEESLFKLNWLVTSKSGFSEPNWQTSVLSLTPSTLDSFIGVNLLKNYYKYVKYDFVSYKLFTRQLQLIQLCAILLNIVHRILSFYRESVTLSSITNTLNSGATGGAANNFSNLLYNDALAPTLLSFSFSADKYRPISWSANHVTLYNVQNSANNRQSTMSPNLLANGTSSQSPVNNANEAGGEQDQARPPSTGPQRRNDKIVAPYVSREEQMRQIKDELFLREINEFLKISTNRLNVQAQLANRTGYFYIVNQSTGLVLQAVDFTSTISLKEQVEQNQKRIQNSSFKSINGSRSPSSGGGAGGGHGGHGGSSGGGSTVSKGPRFYLMPKINTQANKSPHKSPGILVAAAGSNNPASLPSSSSLTNETASDEQLWYYYLINGCVANKVIRSGYCMAASSLNVRSPVCFWPNVKTTNCSWFFDSQDQTIVSGLNDDLVLDYVIVEDAHVPGQQRYAVVIDTKVPNKASQKWSLEFC